MGWTSGFPTIMETSSAHWDEMNCSSTFKISFIWRDKKWLFSLPDVATNVLGVEVRSELSVWTTSLIGRKSRYTFAFSNPMGRSCNWHVHKPWLNQTNSDILTPEFNVFSEEMSLWSHWLWKSTVWQDICHPLNLHKIKKKHKEN